MDTHGMKFVVDTTGVAKGFRDYKAAVDGIFSSLSKFEAHVDKTMKGVAKASANPQALNAFKRAVSAFAKVDIDTSAARKLSALSAAMSGFKAPSAAQTANTRRFFNSLNNLPDLGRAYRSIRALSDLKTAMAGFKAPPASAAKNLSAFASAMRTAVPAFNNLRSISGTASIANELALLGNSLKNLKTPSAGQVTNLGNLALALRAFNFSNLQGSGNFYAALAAIGNFRAPTPAQIRNLQNFVTAVGQMRVPANAPQVAAALHLIAAAAQRAGASLGGLRAGMGGLGGSLNGVGSSARGASLQMMGLQNAFSSTFQVGSVLRSLLGSLTLAELGRNFFDATNAMIQFKAQMGVVSKSLGFADSQMQFVRQTANAFGTDMLGAAAGYAKVSIAASKAGLSVGQTQEIFSGMSAEMAVLGTTTAGQQDVWLALQQVMNKGYLSAEELNQQLNEKLPGAMAYASEYAAKFGLTLEKGLKTKALDAAGVLTYMAKRMKEDFGPSVTDALMRPAAQMNILKNNFNSLFVAIGENGGNEAFASLLLKINERMKPEDIDRFAKAIGEGLKNAVDKVAAAFDWLYNNWDSIKGPLSTTLSLMGRWAMISGTLQITRFIVQPLMQIGPALTGLRTLGGLLTVLSASSLPAAIRGITALGVANNAAVVSFLALRNRMVAAAAASRAAGVSILSLSGMMSAASATAGGLRAAFAGLVNMLGGPLVVSLAAAAAGLYALYSYHEDTVNSISKSKGIIADNNKLIDDLSKFAYGAAYGVDTLGKDHQAAVAPINNFAGAVGGAAQQLWEMARAQKAATLSKLMDQSVKLQQQNDELYKKTSGGVKQELNRKSTGVLDLLSTTGNAAMYGLDNLVTGTGANDAAVAQMEENTRSMGRLTEMMRALNNKKLEDWVDPKMRGAVGAGSKKDDTEPKGSKRKVKSFEDQANSVENAVDQLMGKLMETDPIGKLYRDFVKNVTDEAHVLLNNKGYKQFTENVKADSKDGQLSVESLIKAMQDSGNLSTAAMNDIKTRYGKTSEYIINALREQQAALEDAYKDAAIKQVEHDFRSLAKGIDAVGDSIPAVAELGSNIQTLTDLAYLVMPAGEDFKKFLSDIRNGSLSAADALAKLNAIMSDPTKRSAGVSQLFANSDANPQDLAAATARKLGQSAYNKREAEIDLEFGTRLLNQRNDEIMLLRMSSKEAEVYKTVQDEVNRIRATGAELTQKQIEGLIGEVRSQQELADQLQRNRELFENNGIRTYINDIKSAGEAINDLDKNLLQSLEDQLVSLGTKGTFSFSSIFNTLQEGLVRFASQNLIKEGLGALFGNDALNNGQPSLTGKLLGLMGIKNEAAQSNPLGSQFNPMHVVISGQNGLLGTVAGGSPILGGEEDPLATYKDSLTTTVKQAGDVIKTDWTSSMRNAGGIIQQMLSSIGGGGGGGGLLGTLVNLGVSALGGGISAGTVSRLTSSAASTIASNPGIFKEGGLTSSPVARGSLHPAAFVNAPHYKEGTHNTSGGMPAILHDNEAVIPLSRGRKVAVELSGKSRGQTINNNFNIVTPDADSFKKSRQQIATDMHMQAGRAYNRNYG